MSRELLFVTLFSENAHYNDFLYLMLYFLVNKLQYKLNIMLQFYVRFEEQFTDVNGYCYKQHMHTSVICVTMNRDLKTRSSVRNGGLCQIAMSWSNSRRSAAILSGVTLLGCKCASSCLV